MARSVTMVKSRTAPAPETISFPVLTYSDALPRNDLRDLGDGAAKRRQAQSKLAHSAFARPQTPDGRQFKRPLPDAGATFDFQLTAPPDEVVPSSARAGRSPLEHHTIGVALGSPGMVDDQGPLPPPRFNTSIFDANRMGQSVQPTKSSKWKKIGGFFRAKNALASPTVQAHGDRSKQPLEKESPSRNSPKSKHRRGSIEEWPKIEVDGKHAADGGGLTAQRSRRLSLSGKVVTEEKIKEPLLNVDIPDVQMERYSVMFSNVMNKNQRPPLLARRSRTLDNLRVPRNEEFLGARRPPVPQRRATSPGQSKFALFPTSQPSKAAQILGTQNFSRGPSPLLRSKTLPLESPSRSSADYLRLAHINDSQVSCEASFGPSIISNHMAELSSTPRSSNTYTRKEDKPLPAIKPEPVLPNPRAGTASPQVPDVPKPPREETNAPQLERERNATSSKEEGKAMQSKRDQHTAQTSGNEAIKERMPWQPKSDRSDTHPREERKQQTGLPNETNRPNRPQLTIVTQTRTHPPLPAKHKSPSGTSSARTPGKKSFKGPIELPASPVPITASPVPIRASPVPITASPVPLSAGPKSGVSPSGSTRMPFATEREIEPDELKERAPKIEVSTARSISVSKGKRQMLVPIGARVDHLHPGERLVERKALTPRITDVQTRHKHAISQELQIESV